MTIIATSLANGSNRPPILSAPTGYSETLDIDDADFIYVSVPHISGEDQIDPELFREEVARVILKNLIRRNQIKKQILNPNLMIATKKMIYHFKTITHNFLTIKF